MEWSLLADRVFSGGSGSGEQEEQEQVTGGGVRTEDALVGLESWAA